jgi:light-regulated signal transduction histidine kinase (bacteriophytochrome)
MDLAIPDDLWDVEMDDIQMRQCVENLIIMQRIHAGRGAIHISAENIPDRPASRCHGGKGLRTGDPTCVVRCRQGCASCRSTAENIRSYFSTKPSEAQRTGLGLSICHSIVTRHEGLITVASDAGKGTTVSVYLPCRGRLRKDLDQNFILE